MTQNSKYNFIISILFFSSDQSIENKLQQDKRNQKNLLSNDY